MKNVMKSLLLVVSAGAGSVMAHGAHDAVPYTSLLHVLAHHWPVLLGASTLAVVGWLVQHRR